MTATVPQPQNANVTLIPANPALQKRGRAVPMNRQLRVAAYARVSTDLEEQESSYEAQITYYTDKIMGNKDWALVGIYADEGISGTQMKKRKDFLRMVRDCKKDKIDLIITKSISRFARNTVDSLETIRDLKRRGIGVIFEKENINTLEVDNEIIITLHSCMAQAESESISSNVKWGLRHAFSQGRVFYNYTHWYGYRKGEDGMPEIVPEQAEMVKSIFMDYLAGRSIKSISDALNEQGVLRKRNATWSSATIHKMLQNERYAGDALNQKTFVTDCITHKAVKNRGELPQFYVKDAHAAIIDRGTYHMVQQELARRAGKRKLAENAGETRPSRYSSKYALTELLVCGECGSPYRRATWAKRGKKRVVWRCGSRLDYGIKYCQKSPTIDEDRLHDALTQALAQFLSGREHLLEVLHSSLETAFAASLGQESIAGLQRQKEEIEKTVMQLADTLLGADDPDALDEQFKKLHEERAIIGEKLDAMKRETQEREQLHAAMGQVAATLEQAPLELSGYDDDLVRKLVDTVRVVTSDCVLVTWKDGESTNCSILLSSAAP